MTAALLALLLAAAPAEAPRPACGLSLRLPTAARPQPEPGRCAFLEPATGRGWFVERLDDPLLRAFPPRLEALAGTVPQTFDVAPEGPVRKARLAGVPAAEVRFTARGRATQAFVLRHGGTFYVAAASAPAGQPEVLAAAVRTLTQGLALPPAPPPPAPPVTGPALAALGLELPGARGLTPVWVEQPDTVALVDPRQRLVVHVTRETLGEDAFLGGGPDVVVGARLRGLGQCDAPSDSALRLAGEGGWQVECTRPGEKLDALVAHGFVRGRRALYTVSCRGPALKKAALHGLCARVLQGGHFK